MTPSAQRSGFSANQRWRFLGLTALFCVGIAILVWAIGDASFGSSLAVSLCIGLSINGTFMVFGSYLERFMNPYVSAIPLVALGLCIGMLLGGTLVMRDPLYLFADDNTTLVLGVFFGVVGFALFGTRARLLQAQAELAVAASEHQRQERLITETELKLLQAQIEPHFLFNTLSNIAVLIRSNPDDAERTLLNLTTLLRSSLNRTREAQTTLREELDIARAYLDIHAIRMRERLQYRIESELSLDNLPLPPMLVQPLIENALKHGVDPLENGGCVSIAVHRTADHLIIAVKDNGAGMAEQAPPGTGLRNVRERLYGLYGQAAQLSVSDRRPHGVCAELSIPLAEGTQT